MILQVLAHAGQFVHHRHAQRFEQRARPTPEICSSFGELMLPAARMTSRRARTVSTLPFGPPRT